MTRKNKKVCKTLNYIKHFLILASAISGCISISAFTSLIGIRIGLKICGIAARIKKSKSIIKKKKKKHDKLVFLAKSKSNKIEVSVSKALIDSNISHDEFILINNVLKESEEMKEEIKNLNTSAVH